MRGWSNSLADKDLALYAANPGSISGIPYDPPSTNRSDSCVQIQEEVLNIAKYAP